MKSKILLLISLIFISLDAKEVLLFSTAYELALKNSHQLKSYRYLFEADKEDIKQTRASFYPQLDLTAYYKKSRYKSNLTKQYTNQGLTSYIVSFNQALYNPQDYKKIKIQTTKSKLSFTKLQLLKETLAKDVFSIYLELLKSKAKIRLYKAYLEQSKSKLDELTKKFNLNLTNKVDLLDIKVEYNSAKIELQREKETFRVYKLKLDEYIGDVKYSLPDLKSDKKLLENISKMQQVVQNSYDNSLQIKMAQLNVEISQDEVVMNQKAHYPKINFNASYTKNHLDNPTFDSAYDSIGSAMVKMDLPLYSGGATSSKVASKKLRYFSTKEELLKTIRETKSSYEKNKAMFDSSANTIDIYKTALEVAQLNIEATQKAYEHGLKSIIDLNEAKIKYYKTRYKYIENIYTLISSYMEIIILTNNLSAIKLLDDIIKD